LAEAVPRISLPDGEGALAEAIAERGRERAPRTRILRILTGYVIGLFLTPVAALVGTLPVAVLMSKWFVLAVVYGLMFGSIFAAPVTILVLPTLSAAWPQDRDLDGRVFAAAGAVAGALSTGLICQTSYTLSGLMPVLAPTGAVAGALVALIYVRCARRWAR
jgi:hypothetical protein